MMSGDRLNSVRAEVARVMRDCGQHPGIDDFAQRIQQGEADDSEPMQIGLAVAERLERDLFA